ncbi:MAG: phosphatase PAP2 family protein [Sphingobacteriales bacterium]|nr:phosphatase PAP2 family protein [Sphingobacteriales bacterium]
MVCRTIIVLITCIIFSSAFSQNDSITTEFTKPKPFSFVTNVPREFVQIIKTPFKKKSLSSTAFVIGSTALLIAADQPIYNGVRKLSDNLNLNPAEKNNILWSIKGGSKETVLLKSPGNLNTGFYMMGEGMPALLIAGGLWLHGKIKNDYRSLQTASDLSESFITLGLTTQIAKWISGRENPVVASRSGGAWRPFAPFKDFQNNKPRYDAFPSGHLATMMATVTILANNYPEKKWIKPLGYTLITLTSFAMINNGVHWAGDYPIGIGLGYLSGKIITDRHKKRNRYTALNRF